jgi:hypothetical protein
MNSETAYKAFAHYLIASANNIEYDKMILELEVSESMTRSTCWGYANEVKKSIGKSLPSQLEGELNRAAFFLRSNMLEMTKECIWTIVFTLYPDNKFNISYGYDKPEWLK